MDNKKILILCHGTQVWADNLENMFQDIGHTCDVISLRHGDTFPENIEDYAGIIIMGGNMSVYETEEHPWIEEEIAGIKKAIQYHIPTLGICFGAQMLGQIFGGKVEKGEHGMSVGFHRIRILENDIIFGHELDSIPVCKWHGDRFHLPKSATLIATSKPYPNQAVRFNDCTYGVQFHPEITPCRILKWYGENLEALPEHAPSLEEFIEDCRRYMSQSHTWLKLFFCRLLDK